MEQDFDMNNEPKFQKRQMGRAFWTLISLIYFSSLVHNFFAAKFTTALINLLLFLLTSPWTFQKWKARHKRLLQALGIVTGLCYAIIISYAIWDSIGMMDIPIPEAEQAYIDTVLNEITT